MDEARLFRRSFQVGWNWSGSWQRETQGCAGAGTPPRLGGGRATDQPKLLTEGRFQMSDITYLSTRWTPEATGTTSPGTGSPGGCRS